MNYEELVKGLREHAEQFDYDGWVDTAIWFEKAADAIEELLQIAQHYEEASKGWWLAACDFKEEMEKRKWIPVTERLPSYEPLGNVFLCFHVAGKYGQLSWISVDWWNGEGFVFKKDDKRDHITH